MSAHKVSLHLVALALLLSQSLARAEDTPSTQPVSDEAKERAKRLFDEAETQYRLGRFDAALRGYQAALKVRLFPSILFNIAQCYRHLKNKERALFFYKLFLSDWERVHPGTSPPAEAEVHGHIARLTAELQAEDAERKRRALEAERRGTGSKTARLRLEGMAARARVLVDGMPRAVAPLAQPLDLKPGRHRVEVESEAHYRWSRTVDAQEGQETTLLVELQPLPRRSRLWLGGTIACSLLAAGAESLAIVYYGRANGHFSDTPSFDEDRRVVITGHVLAGTLLAGATASLILYLRSGRRDPGRTAVANAGGFSF
jgi:hypothetical protein